MIKWLFLKTTRFLAIPYSVDNDLRSKWVIKEYRCSFAIKTLAKIGVMEIKAKGTKKRKKKRRDEKCKGWEKRGLSQWRTKELVKNGKKIW